MQHLMRWIGFSGLGALLLAGSVGCAMTRVTPDAFGPAKTYAVVSIVTLPDMGHGASQGSTLSGMVKAASKESGYTNTSGKIFKETVPLILKELQRSKHFRLMPEDKVLRSAAYAKRAGSPTKIFWTTMVPAAGYKYFATEEDLSGLARDLKVDGVITVMVTYNYRMKGVGLFGLLALGKQYGTTRITVSAMDRQGRVVWKDNVEKESDEGIGALGESANFTKLHPLLIQSSKNAVTHLVARFENKL